MSKTARLKTDFLVLGGGTAGCVVASRLARSGFQTILVEAGPDYGPSDSGAWPTEILEPWVLPSRHGWSLSETLANGRESPVERGRVIGGCSAINGCVATWGTESDYDSWARLGLKSWSFASLAPHLRDVSNEFHVRVPSPAELTPFQSACLEAAVSEGFPFQPNVNQTSGETGVGTVPNNISNGVRHNASFAFLDPVRPLDNLRIVDHTFIDRILIAGNSAVGALVVGPDGPYSIEADTVVICAGTYGSPSILLRSGVGPSEELSRLGIPVAIHLAGVGKNLHDQPTVDVRFDGSPALERSVQKWMDTHHRAEEPVLIKAASRDSGGEFDLHVFPVAETPYEGRDWRWVLPVALLTPRSRGQVTLTGADPAKPPRIQHDFFSDALGSDLDRMVDGVRTVLSLAASLPLRELLGSRRQPESEDDLRDWILASHGRYWHPVGTCAMGAHPSNGAVTDELGRVHGLSNCYVADASVIPVVPRANTNIPTAAVASRIATSLVPG